ncbi:PRC-barrel domain-containing protein [Natronorubrum thiooxidans]|uniref:Sporulation protein YlmC, PRC-barrel domain family n=1 Tax=Natronorubrum thiooxidans TaxID=308853 RepID=A0A1N7GDE9_9EURY|nr:PRC-barrel domain-containing protein [Natronorubrum thiooxidans]SIS10591.1 Sporulation protein YlmC, PRC-barrel domain family [Natronorubrum thiooxidans]
MGDVMARDLRGKSIVETDGTTLGTLYNVTIDPDSGMLCDLVVEPREEPSSMVTDETDDDRLRIPVGLVKTVNDRIIIDTD